MKRNMIKKAGVLFLVLAGMTFSPLQASDLKYSYVEGRYILDHEWDDDEGDNGFKFGGSYQVTNSVNALGSYDTYDFDGAKVKLLNVGAGYIHPLNDKWDANASFSFVNGKADRDRGKDDSDTGFSFSGGVRGIVMPQIEARGNITYLNIDLGGDEDDFFAFGFAGDYFIMPNLAAGLEITFGDIESISLGARFFFD